MSKYSRVYETVDLSAICHNITAMKENVGDNTSMIGVVKADGYGHGAVPVAWTIEPYVWGFAVASVQEGVILRRNGIKKPVLILGVTPEEEFDDVLRYDLRPAIFRYEEAETLSILAQKSAKKVVVHIAVDTGMSRIGCAVGEAAADEVARMKELLGIGIEGIFTHFARADEREKTSAIAQIAEFKRFVGLLEKRGARIPLLHCANSAAILEIREADFNLARAGISLYGLYPSDEVEKERVSLIPAMELKSMVSYVKRISPGTPVSYGGTFTADREMKIATIPVGYADGYPRNLSGRGDVLIRGRRARILGRVCMDQFMVDVTAIDGVEAGEAVTLIGRDAGETISIEELAERSGGFHYEILCNIGKRVPRIYVKDGKTVGSKDYFDDTFDQELCAALKGSGGREEK